MTTEHDQGTIETAATDRKYLLLGFVVGLLLGLLIVVPLAFMIIN
jgi:hypothetical protein